MKKIISVLMSLAALISITSGFNVTAHATENTSLHSSYERFEYVIKNEEVTITGYDYYDYYNNDNYDESITDIVIPDYIDGYPVTEIDDAAFCYGNYLVDEFLFNDTVKSIKLPSGLKKIGIQSFGYLMALQSIDLPDSLIYIDAGAFMGSGLREVYIPDSVEYIGPTAFTTAYKILVSAGIISYKVPDINIELSDTNSYYKMINGILYSKDGTRLIADYSQDIGTLNIPESVKTIEPVAFAYSNVHEKIIIPASVQTIGEGAFHYSVSLAEIIVADTNEFYSSDAGILYNKEMTQLILLPQELNITKFTVPDSVKKVETLSIANNKNLTYLDFNNVKVIEDSAVIGNLNLKNIVFSESLEYIGENAFSNNLVLENVELPGSVKYLGSGAFEYCTGLKSVEIANGITDLAPSLFFNCVRLESIHIPSSVSNISDSCFGGIEFDQLKIVGEIGSFASQFASENSIQFDCGLIALGTTIRINERPGLKFGFSIEYNENIDKMGFVYSYSPINESELNLENPSVKIKEAANYTFENNKITFNLVFTDIPFEGIQSDVYVKAYIISEGKIYYSSMICNDYLNVASRILNDETIDEQTKQRLYEIFSVYL